MDNFDFRSQCNINTEGVFDGNVKQCDEIDGLFLKLKNVLVSELHTGWDVAYLEQYVTQKMVPRSSRWEVNPQKDESDLEGWFVYFNKTGVQFLQFLLGKKHNKLKSPNEEITLIKNKLGPYKVHEIYKQKSDQLGLFLEKEDHDQKNQEKEKNLIVILLIIPIKWYSNGRLRLMSLWKVRRESHILHLYLYLLSL